MLDTSLKLPAEEQISPFAQKMLTPQELVTIFELVPPSHKTPAEKIEEDTKKFLNDTYDSPVDAINIPEIRTEELSFITPKYEPRAYAQFYQKAFGKDFPIIINRCAVHETFDEQKKWLNETYNQFGINNFIIVGGTHSNIKYPGPSVLEMSQMIKEEFPQILCGGISLADRKSTKNSEAKRIHTKTQAGIDFFTGQILYDDVSTTHLLETYSTHCQENKQTPRRLILTFSPASREKCLNFYKTLGVHFKEEYEKKLSSDSENMAQNSIEISAKILENILKFNANLKTSVPIGINIGPVMKYNYPHSLTMLKKLKETYKNFYQVQS